LFGTVADIELWRKLAYPIPAGRDPPEGIRGTALSPDGGFVIVTDSHNEQRIWSLDKGDGQPIKGLESNECAFAWTADAKEKIKN